MAALLNLVPVSQVTYGTDYPYFPLDQNNNLSKLGLSTTDMKAIESGNAARLIPRTPIGLRKGRIPSEFAAVHESAYGVRRDKAALSSGCKPHPATAPAGSNRSSHGGNEVAEAFD